MLPIVSCTVGTPPGWPKSVQDPAEVPRVLVGLRRGADASAGGGALVPDTGRNCVLSEGGVAAGGAAGAPAGRNCVLSEGGTAAGGAAGAPAGRNCVLSETGAGTAGGPALAGGGAGRALADAAAALTMAFKLDAISGVTRPERVKASIVANIAGASCGERRAASVMRA